MISFFTRNFWIKLASFVIGFLIWFSIIIYQDPVITKTISNIPVIKENEYLVTNQKKEINYVEGNTITIRVKGKKKAIDNLTANDVRAYADLQYISVTGAVDINVDTNENISVIERTPDKMIVDLENIVTVQREIQYLFEGTAVENYVISEPLLTPNYLNITGAESKINQIRKVIVPITIEGATKDITMFIKPQILDYRNEEIGNLKSNVSEVKVQASVNYSKTIPVTFEPNGSLDPNLSLENVKIEPSKITIYGAIDALKNINAVRIQDYDMSTITEDMETATTVDKYIPNGAAVVEGQHTLTISFDVEPIITKILQIPTNRIKLTALPKDMSINFMEEFVAVEITGKANTVNTLTYNDFELTADLQELIDLGLQELVIYVKGPASVTLTENELLVPIEAKASVTGIPEEALGE